MHNKSFSVDNAVSIIGGSNIRRTPSTTACESQSREILKDKEVEAELLADAGICFAVRRELAEGDTSVDSAVRIS